MPEPVNAAPKRVSSVPKTVGIIGGMGPDATVDFFAKLVTATPAERDQDHLHLLIDNDPTVPDRNAAIAGEGPSPAPQLAAMARRLVGAGAQLLVMPCNGAHAFADAVREAAPGVPFLSLIDATVHATQARASGVRAVGLLATDGTLSARLYHDAFERVSVTPLAPSETDQRSVMAAIYAVKRGEHRDEGRDALRGVAERLCRAGAEALILACTELPLLLREGDVVMGGAVVPVIASTDALVERTLAAAREHQHA